jgi:hypothetical protein
MFFDMKSDSLQVIYHGTDFAGTLIGEVLGPACWVFDFVILEAEEASSSLD